MSERKVLSKYYPPDFDPSKIERVRGGKKDGPVNKQQTVRLMAPCSMKCTSCGEYIYKGRKFNARKETTEERYLEITIFRFYIKCTRCSGEITFKTDPKHMDYEVESGAKRNFEPWREAKLAEETDEERLDRLQREEDERDPMKELEKKAIDAKTEMAIADALDDVRHRNAARERMDQRGDILVQQSEEGQHDEFEEIISEASRAAFLTGTGEKVRRLVKDDDAAAAMPPPSSTPWQRPKAKKHNFSAALGVKKKAPLVGVPSQSSKGGPAGGSKTTFVQHGNGTSESKATHFNSIPNVIAQR